MADLRLLFREASGRADLADADVDMYLDAGRLFLNNSSETDMPSWDEDSKPLPVVFAAMYNYDYLYRNREGALEWLEKLGQEVKELNFLFIEEKCRNITKMEG